MLKFLRNIKLRNIVCNSLKQYIVSFLNYKKFSRA